MYNNNNNNNNNNNTQYSHSGPLFSQPFDPSTLNATSDFDSSMDAWDFCSQVNIPESILLSDPNFLRQHQLLQEQQKEMHTRLTHDDERHEQVSNLTAMFEPVVKIEGDKKSKKTQNRRQQIVMTNNNDNNNDDDDDTVDHQRRFNELQARFRVNYARKQVNHVKATNNKPAKPQAEPIIQMNNKTTTTTQPLPPPPPPSSSSLSSAMIGINNEENTELLSSSFPSRTMPIQIQRVSRLNSSQPFDAESHQKQLDNQLDKVDFDDITVSELKEMLRQRGKPATGKKAVLLQRLQEEREISKGGRSAGSFGSSASRLLSNRHSQPVPRSVNNNNIESPQRPRSFQSSSPVMIQAANNNNSTAAAAASPASPGTSLHRSIANMHIGSPPTSSISRRYSPYSPRLSSSPKPVHHEYSSSVPLSSSPTNNNNVHSLPNNNMMLSSSYSAKPSCRYYNKPKTYKPFMSSALATPDREEDVNPFDAYYNTPIKEEVIDYDPEPSIKQEPMPEMNNQQHDINLDWMDPTAFDILLQQQQAPMLMDNNQQQFLSNEQIMAMLNTQQQQQQINFDFRLDDTSFNHHQPYYYHPSN